MAKRKPQTRRRASSPTRKTAAKAAPKARAAKRRKKGKAAATRKSAPKRVAKRVAKPLRASTTKKKAVKRRVVAKKAKITPRLDRKRKTLDEVNETPPSSLDMVRRGTSVRSGRAEIAQGLREHRGMSSDITGGDVDVNVQDAYFTGDGAPGGDNPAPDEEVVDEIGRALGVEYQDNEELKASEKVTERDRHRWELDPASAEDYKDRK